MFEMLKQIEIEISSFCNRKCDWCPNKEIDRTFDEKLPLSIVKSVAKDLAKMQFGKNHYGGFITFSRNNEPFASADYLEEVISIFKEHLPYVNFISNTNGDFLDEALKSSVSEISIMDYDNQGYKTWKKRMENYEYKEAYLDGNLLYMKGKKKVVICLDWSKNTLIENRGGFFLKPIDAYKWRSSDYRDDVCLDPYETVCIDYNSSVMPCCCTRHEFHENFILGNLHDKSLIDILKDDVATNIRKDVLNKNELPKYCKKCHKGKGRYTRENPSIEYSERYVRGGGK